jgi:hypothetical protein
MHQGDQDQVSVVLDNLPGLTPQDRRQLSILDRG